MSRPGLSFWRTCGRAVRRYKGRVDDVKIWEDGPQSRDEDAVREQLSRKFSDELLWACVAPNRQHRSPHLIFCQQAGNIHMRLLQKLPHAALPKHPQFQSNLIHKRDFIGVCPLSMHVPDRMSVESAGCNAFENPGEKQSAMTMSRPGVTFPSAPHA